MARPLKTTVIFLALPGPALARQQFPATVGSGGRPGAGASLRGYPGTPQGDAILFRVVSPNRKGGIRLLMPPPPERRDEGAVEAAVEIVVARNPEFSSILLAKIPDVTPSPARPEAAPVSGDLYLRISKPASFPLRRDIPANAFAATALRGVPYPQFPPTRRE